MRLITATETIVARSAAAALIVAVVLNWAVTIFDWHAASRGDPVSLILYGTVFLLAVVSAGSRWLRTRPERRRPWLLMATGLLLLPVGGAIDVVAQSGIAVGSTPALADLVWLLALPFFVLAVRDLALLRQPDHPHHAGSVLDALGTGLLVMGALCTVTVAPRVDTTGPMGTLITAAFPTGDALVVAAVVVAASLSGWGLAWVQLAVGFSLWTCADTITTLGAAPQSVSDAIILTGVATVAFAPWTSLHAFRRGPRPLPAFAISMLLGVAATVSLVVSAAVLRNPAATAFSVAALLAFLARSGMATSSSVRSLAASEALATVDALTALGNRRACLDDVERRLRAGAPAMLVMFDLNGFKAYNDLFGHPAGDALLVRVAHRLSAEVLPSGKAYRLGGDEFCAVLGTSSADPDTVGRRLANAVRESGPGYQVTSAFGVARLPGEGSSSHDLLTVADARMYSCKRRDRVPMEEQLTDILLALLGPLDPGHVRQARSSADLAGQLASACGASERDVLTTTTAALLLHVADMVSDAPTGSTSPSVLSALAEAPDLDRAVEVMIAVDESWDGSGDCGLTRGEIPLAARVLRVVRTFHGTPGDRLSAQERFELVEALGGSVLDPALVGAMGVLLELFPRAAAIGGNQSAVGVR